MLSGLTRDVRFAFRQFAGRPGFTFTAVLVLALGLGANTAIFNLVYSFLLRPLPFPHPDRLVTLAERAKGRGGDEDMGVSPGNFLEWQQQAGAFDHISAFLTGSANLSSDTNAFQPERLNVCYCSGNILATLGAAPLLGRTYLPEEDRFQGPHVALIAYRIWKQRFGGAPDIVGKSIRLDGDSFEIVGVMPAGFLFPTDSVQIWAPILTGFEPSLQIRRDLHFLSLIARLRPGVSIGRARAELSAIMSRYKQQHGDVAMGEGA